MVNSTRQEKEQRIIELYLQGNLIRVIAKDVHMAFGPICAVINKFKSENEMDDNKHESVNPASKATQSFKLFSEGKKPVQVVIELDMPADEVNSLYQQFWRLERLYGLASLY